MEFDWDDGKSDRCLRERGFDFAYAARLFDDETIEFHDRRRDYGEDRIIAFGRIDGRRFAVVYTDRVEARWIIAAFKCEQRELERWQRRDAAGLSDRAGSTSPGSRRPRRRTPAGT